VRIASEVSLDLLSAVMKLDLRKADEFSKSSPTSLESGVTLFEKWGRLQVWRLIGDEIESVFNPTRFRERDKVE
jgi:hypothetical protein